MQRSEIERLLPGIFQRTVRPGTPLFALLAAMEALHDPDERVLAELATFFDPYRAPVEFVPVLARWVDMERFLRAGPEDTSPFSLPVDAARMREIVASATFLAQWRGTTRGLLHFLELATGVSGFVINEQVIDQDGRRKPYHIRIQFPRAAASHLLTIERIILSEKPAYITYELVPSTVQITGDEVTGHA